MTADPASSETTTRAADERPRGSPWNKAPEHEFERKPASGLPARGYRWEPFEPGNFANLRHGARSERKVSPLAEAASASLVEVAPWCASPAFAPTIASWSWAEGQAALLRAWTDEHGLLDEDGQPSGAAAMLERVERRLVKLRAELGLSPQSLGQLLSRAASIASATGDVAALEALRAEGRRILDARAELEPAGGEEGAA